MPSSVIDASVFAKWFNRGEQYEGEALHLKDDYLSGRVELLAPRLLLYEVLNAIRKNRNLRAAEAVELAAEAYELSPTLLDLDSEQVRLTVSFAREASVSCYDSTYIVLAKRSGVQLITADEKQLEAARKFADCLHLRQYGTPMDT